jgi:hypothetical protein
MAGGTEYDARKLQELIVYVAGRSENDTRFGSTKLNKILFYADFESFRRTGQSITGAVYQRLPNGPAPHQLLPALGALVGSVTERRVQTPAGSQRRIVPLRDADTSLFSGTEIALVEEVLTALAPMTGKQVSDASHNTMAWQLTQDGQEIPYGTAFLTVSTPAPSDLVWLKGIASGRVAA